MSESLNAVMPFVSITYPEMLKNAKRAKSERRDTFKWFLQSATSSGAYRMGRVIECRENVAGMTVIFICMALIKYKTNTRPEDGIVEELKGHLEGLKMMRTSTSVPLCMIPEKEGIMFPGEGMSLRFLNALIILESFLLSKISNTTKKVIAENWGMYSSLDLMISLELPALLDVLDDEEKRVFADKLSNDSDDGDKENYCKERRVASKLIKSTVSTQIFQRVRKEEEDVKFGQMVMVLILIVIYTLFVIKFSQNE